MHHKKFCRKIKLQFGFTLVEVMISVALFAILAGAVIALVGNIITTTRQQGTLLSDSDQARRLSVKIMSELRNAVASNTGAYALEQAADQQIIFYSNVDGGADIEKLRYYISNGSLYRGLTKPLGNPLTYTGATEASTLVQANVGNGTVPLFYYYPDTYTGTGNALAQPVNVTQVRFVQVSLKVFNKAGVTNTNTYTITASGTIRSLKTNLGN
jgi:prepilin-type N-terminal cleavage/methylation domain-containing protein